MTVETDIDALAARVNIRKDKAVRVKGDLDALVTEGTSVAALATTAAASTLVVRTEATSMSTAATALATSAVGASSFADLSALAASKSEVATDVFIYDTSLDSDGGAWRFRTQGTSWYQETLNTATRGSRREFPAVAVIVAEASKVTIYDGDTAGLPMWMVFTSSAAPAIPQIWRSGRFATSVTAQNSIVCLGVTTDGQGGLVLMALGADKMSRYAADVHTGGITVAQRNEPLTTTSLSAQFIVSGNVNDVAMTALPNAPIDSATGLPVPTIAVATNGGVSVIKDNGTVVSIAPGATAWTNKVEFIGSFIMVQGAYCDYSPWVISIPDSNVTGWAYPGQPPGITKEEYNTTGSNQKTGANLFYLGVTGQDGKPISSDRNNRFFATSSGVSTIAANTVTPSEGLASYATSQYSTGWMHGAIKGAWLADTSDADLIGGELVMNGNFATDTAWTKTGAASISGGKAVLPSLSDSIRQQLIGPAGTYRVSFDYTDIPPNNGGATITLSSAFGYTGTNKVIYSGSAVMYITAVSSNPIIAFNLPNSGTPSAGTTIDNISVRLVDLDRSVNANPLTIVGRIQRTPVADNADLVGYSGFSATNYLEQPYNSGLDFGTGDFSIMGWVKYSGNNQRTMVIRQNPLTGFYSFWLRGSANTVTFAINNGVQNIPTSSGSLVANTWSHVCAMRKSGILYVYINGVLSGSAAGTASVTQENATLGVGIWNYPGAPQAFGDPMALLRISGTAPSADQIAKIFKDERKLFEPGARCTLYGSSDAVTALSYDKVTNLLHVGTSAGRSVFDGLVRVSNTTTPVRAVIAAHGGLVIED